MAQITNTTFTIRMLDGAQLLRTAKRVDTNNQITYIFSYDYNKIQMNFITKSVNEYDDCAFFYQFKKVLGTEDIYDHMFFVDFESNGISLFDNKDNEQRLQDLFINGINIVCGETTRTFVPKDKSNSMSRESKISFIDSTYSEALDNRLNLGIENITSSQLMLSKYFSYRGGYLSTGKRVTHDKFIIDETTFVILPNILYKKLKDIDILTAKQSEDSLANDTSKWTIQQKKEDYTIQSVFDGEGIISPEYAGYINESLNNNDLTSFQIRLPFVKGMLHQVDFHSFIKEYANKGDNESYYIKDIFGVTRDLSKAHIIIDKNMFKFLSFNYPQNIENIDESLAKQYFKGIKEYEHGMYITNYNHSSSKAKITSLNYQIFNTLALDKENIDELVKKQEEYINDPISYLKLTNKNPLHQPTWQEMVIKDSRFATSYFVKQMLEGTKNSLIDKIGLGRISVSGEYRYLSRDLLPFLVRIVEKLTDKNGNSMNLDIIKSFNTIGTNSFYMPNNRIELKKDSVCAFFRNPHLSRNEECVLRNFYPNKVYKKYFSHLSGIVMVACDSLVPAILGGADFDGDEVKIINDEIIVNAVKRGCYKETEDGGISRKLPVIVIPSDKSGTKDLNKKNTFEVIKNTFSNKVGQISNAAIRIGQVQYAYSLSELEDYNNRSCQACTILTGLEIDSAKSGRHPDLSLILGDNKKSSSKKVSSFDYIRDIKNLINANYRFTVEKISGDTDSYKVYRRKKDKTPLLLFDCNVMDKNPLATFSGHYLRNKVTNKKSNTIKIEKPFEKVTLNEDSSEYYKILAAIIKAYNDIVWLNSKLNRVYEAVKQKEHIREMYKIISIQYDERYRDDVMTRLLDVEAYITNYFTDMQLNNSDTDIINDSIKKLTVENWNYAHSYDEKKSVLKNIFENMDEYYIESMTDILFNFNNNGYNLLFFVLLDVKAMFAESLTTEEIADELNNRDNSIDNKDGCYCHDTYSEVYNNLKNILYSKRDEKVNSEAIKRHIFKECKNKITSYDDVNTNFKNYDVLKFIYSIDKKGHFFWSLYDVKEISEAVSYFDSKRGQILC